MTKVKRVQYTIEFKQEAVRLVESGQTIAAAARSLGVVEHTLGNWVQEQRAGKLKGVSNKPQVTAEQMENSRLLGRTGASDDGARHTGKSDGILCATKATAVIYAEPSFSEDEGRPLGIGLQELVSNRLKLHW